MGVPFISIVLVLAVTGLTLLAMLVFGIRSFMFGKVSLMTTVAILLPVVLMFVLGFVLGDWALAAIYSILIMLVVAILAMLYSSVRGLVGMR